jgi:hypothetical protein
MKLRTIINISIVIFLSRGHPLLKSGAVADAIFFALPYNFALP